MQPNLTYIPKLVGLMKVSGRRKKGLPYHVTLEAFSADLVIENEMLDGEQSPFFRSGLGLAFYLAMDGPDFQFAAKILSSHMARPSVKALSALKDLASYLDGTAEHGLMLQCAEEDRCVFDVWRDDEMIADEVQLGVLPWLLMGRLQSNSTQHEPRFGVSEWSNGAECLPHSGQCGFVKL